MALEWGEMLLLLQAALLVDLGTQGHQCRSLQEAQLV